MRSIFSYRKRVFLNPASTDSTSYIHAIVESSRDGEYKWGSNLVYIADCHRRVGLEFILGSKRQRRLALQKINLLLSVLTQFRDALAKEIALIDKTK